VTRRYHSTASLFEASTGFSRAVRARDRILVSGTAPVEPNGQSTPGGAEAQAQRCLQIIVDAVTALGGRPEDVAGTRMLLSDPADAEAIGRAHQAVLGHVRAAATMVAGAILFRPAWQVEIEAEAIVADA
jgi:enamine deaminase RidA (YjgF/YER057c/UK114 family)